MKAIGVSGQQHGLVPLDADGQVQGLPARHRFRPPCAPVRASAERLFSAAAPPPSICALAVSPSECQDLPCHSISNGHDAVASARPRQVIRNAKLWCDVESAEEAAALSAEWGITLVPGFTASKLAWLKKREPENWARLRHVLLPHDYVNHFLTGRHVMEARSTTPASPRRPHSMVPNG